MCGTETDVWFCSSKIWINLHLWTTFNIQTHINVVQYKHCWCNVTSTGHTPVKYLKLQLRLYSDKCTVLSYFPPLHCCSPKHLFRFHVVVSPTYVWAPLVQDWSVLQTKPKWSQTAAVTLTSVSPPQKPHWAQNAAANMDDHSDGVKHPHPSKIRAGPCDWER